MANVVKKDGNQQQPQQPQGGVARRDPFLQLVRDPLQMIRDFFFEPFRMGGSMWNPNFEVRETDNAYIFKGDLPGVKSDDIEVTAVENRILISGKRDQETEQDEGTIHAYERSYGSFARSFSLPDTADLDKVSVDLKDGVLTLVVPKKQIKAPQKRKIPIGSATKA
jgi:HSP20 family protein